MRKKKKEEMKKKENGLVEKNVKLGIVLTLLAISILSLATIVSAASYSRTNPAYTQTTFPAQTGIVDFPFMFNRQMCGAGQDFILQVSPTGCIPSVVRSDLLEEQNVPVFCPITGMQVNPLVDVQAVNNIRFSYQGIAPPEVQGLSYMPARAALGSPLGLFGNSQIQINQPGLNNMGYAVIVLRQQRNESAMPDFVQGNLTATLRYDVKNAFGVGRAVYYLPEISDEAQWQDSLTRYGFWQGRGYVRAERITDNSASISIYSDRENYGLGKTGDKRKISSNTILVNNFTRVPMPGFNYCLGEMEVKLDGLVNPDTRARLRINEDFSEFKKGQLFLDNNCEIKSLEKYGLVQRARISCREDDGGHTSDLLISPKINLSIEGMGTKGYSVGDFLYAYSTKDSTDSVVATRRVYLGFVGTTKGNNVKEELYATLVAIPEDSRAGSQMGNLTDSEISSVAGYNKGGFSKVTAQARGVAQQWKFSETLSYGESKNIFEKRVNIDSFASAVNEELPSSTVQEKNLKNNYTQAMKDYETIRQEFSVETYSDDQRMLGERALVNEIDLAWNTNQKKTAFDLCKEFSESYPNSEVPPDCKNALKLSSTETDTMDVLINGKTYILAFDGVQEPSPEEYSVDVHVEGGALQGDKNGIGQNEKVSVSDTESFELVDLDKDSATFDVRGIDRRAVDLAKVRVTINKGSSEFVGKNNYKITVNEVHLKKMAMVSINPRIDFTETKANVSFRIGIEKRGIQLSPEKTRAKIESLNKTLERWKGINTRLGEVVKIEKTACLGVGAGLTLKNFLSNLGGAGIARQKVMRDAGGWFEMCQNGVNQKTPVPANGGVVYNDVDKCLLGNSDNIEASVNVVSDAMKKQDDESKKIQSLIPSKSFLGENIVNAGEYMNKYVDDKYNTELTTNVASAGINTITVGGSTVQVADIISSITPTTIFLSQAKNLQLNSRLLNEPGVVGNMARAEVRKELGDIWANNAKIGEQKDLVQEVGSEAATLFSSEKLKEVQITTVETWKNVKAKYSGAVIDDNSFVYFLKDQVDGQRYLVVLDNDYVAKQTYKISGTVLSIADNENINPLKLAFKKYDASAYENPYPTGSARISYFETDPYKGLPAVVPFDLKNGWYAAVKSVLPIGGGIKPYDDSGRISNFWLCNIGPNKKEEGIGVGDDICQGFVPRAGQPPAFSGLDSAKAAALATKAEEAIIVASQARARNPGVDRVTINGQVIRVGAPAVDIPDIQCQDFMSPSDCNLLFNVCDPVVCPSSRCDLGGTYPVKDVVQSGVIGSLMLCAPNFPDVKIPICLSGVNAGLEGYISVMDSYQKCLQTSLETGQTIGVCDEIHSVYECDFFWRQGLPVAKIVVPKLIGSALGQKSRGGGEYLGVQDAWKKAGDSVDFFTQYYAENSYKAFKARSAEGIGTEVCKNWVSYTAPDGGNLLDALTTPDVPVQFYGRFDEIPYTTATNPPISQYKVFYHIFAGKDFPAYYQVYLKGEVGTFFQDTNFRRVIANGFIKQGDYATETKDITAPSGYTQMCIVVNNQEECGFKQVTTEFGVNYVTEQFVAQQANQTDITSEAACISGTPSALSLLTPNAQSAAESALNPDIYNRGITRICATNNPGTATDGAAGTADARWRAVGICGNTNIKCWLDTQSVKDTIKSTTTECEALGNCDTSSSGIVNALGNAELSPDKFSDLVKSINEEADPFQKLKLIAVDYNKVSVNNRRGYLTLLRADAYKEITKEIFAKWLAGKPSNAVKEPVLSIQPNLICLKEDGSTWELSNGRVSSPSCTSCHTYTEAEFCKTYPDACGGKSSVILNCVEAGEGTWELSNGRVSSPSCTSCHTYTEAEFCKTYPETCKPQTIVKATLATTSCVEADGITWGLSKNVVKAFGCTDIGSAKCITYTEAEFCDKYPDSCSGNTISQKVSCPQVKATKCEDCGGKIFDTNICNANECTSIAQSIGKNCVFNPLLGFLPVGGSCTEEAKTTDTTTKTPTTTQTQLTCTTTEECRKVLGNEIIKLAKAEKVRRGSPDFMSDAVVKRSTGAKSFECLTLQVAFRESGISQCLPIQENGNPLHCAGDITKTVHWDQFSSIGIMEVNTAFKNAAGQFIGHCGTYGLSSNVEECKNQLSNLETDVNVGIKVLIAGYNSGSKTFTCTDTSYSEWRRALRNYNGWGCNGNNEYVEDVLGFKDEVANLFPECA